jgi:hypothetical protein
MKRDDIIEKHAKSIHHVVEACAYAQNIEQHIDACIDRCVEMEGFMDKDEFYTLINQCISLKSGIMDLNSATSEVLDVAKKWALANMHREFKELDDEN